MNMSRIFLAISAGSTFHILFSANFSGVKLPPVLQHIILLALFSRGGNSIEMQGDFAILIFSSVSKPPVLLPLPYVSDVSRKRL